MISKIALILSCLYLVQASLAGDSEQQNYENKKEEVLNEKHTLLEVAAENGDSAADVAKSRSTRGTCDYNGCNTFCRKLGHARGVCIGTYCQCRFRKRRSVPQEKPAPQELQSGATNFVDAVLSRQRRSCGAGECNTHCKKLGHARGVCIGTYCQCRSR